MGLGAMPIECSSFKLRGHACASVIRKVRVLLDKCGEKCAGIASALLLIFCVDLRAQLPEGVKAATDGTTNVEKATQPKDTAEMQSKMVRAIEILRDECVSCHRSGKSKGGLILTGEERLRAGASPVLRLLRASRRRVCFSPCSRRMATRICPRKSS